jgi:hypothetical protein
LARLLAPYIGTSIVRIVSKTLAQVEYKSESKKLRLGLLAASIVVPGPFYTTPGPGFKTVAAISKKPTWLN